MTVRSVPAPVSWMRKTGQMYAHLRERGPVDFDLPRFRAWLAISAQNYGEPRKELLVWECVYSGRLLTLAEIVIDHKTPVSALAKTTIADLAVCSAIHNFRKGQIPHDLYVRLMRWVEQDWPKDAAADLWGRLAARKSWHVRQAKARKDGAAMIDRFMDNVRRGGK